MRIRKMLISCVNLDHALIWYFSLPLQKLLTSLMPTDEERTMIADAKAAKPDLPLEPAEEFLYTLSSIPELKARLSLLKFNYEFQQVEEVRIPYQEPYLI